MKHRNTIIAASIGTLAVALVAINQSAIAGPKSLHLNKSEIVVKSPHSGGLHSQAPLIETTGFETPDWDAYNANGICNGGANAAMPCATIADCPGGTCDVDNFICGSTWWGYCVATPDTGGCTGVPSTDHNCCTGSPNPLNGWFVSVSSQHCREPHIEIANPAPGGTQHMRFTRDALAGNPSGCVGLGGACRVNAFTPDMGVALPVGPTTISWDISENSSFGQTMLYFTVSTAGPAGTYVYFTAAGNIYIYDQSIGDIAPPVPFDYTGPYKNFRIEKDPCADTLKYFYDGNMIYQTTTSGDNALNVERAIFLTDNAGGSAGPHYVDIDNYSVVRGSQCPTTCGANGVEIGEQCDPSDEANSACPAARCDANCQCTPICTLAEPCILHNGPNGPFTAPFDPAFAAIFLYQSTTPFVEIDTCGSSGADTRITFWGSAYDPYDPGNGNDDCEDQDSYGVGSDPNASCFNNVGGPDNLFNSCTCYGIPDPQDTLYLAQIIGNGGIPPIGTSLIVNIEKKAQCAGDALGSCCDSNGADQGCTDDVPQTACIGADKHWAVQKCVDVTCTCIPDCTGVTCGGDGCGGQCPDLCSNGSVCDGTETCDFGTGQCMPGTPLTCDNQNACDGVETCDPVNGCQPGTPPVCDNGNACDGVESCNPSSGCVAGTPLVCDNGNACDGVETCNPASGCVAGTPISCDDGVDCTVDSCDSATGACTHDDSGCFTPIPTVSQWGIAVMALLLLIGAKIYFSRRQSVA